MDLRGGFRGRDRGGGEAHGFRRLLLGGLGRPQVRSNCLEDFLRMIAQLQRHHVACRWQAGGREGLPFAQDPLHVADDEIGESHDGPDILRWKGGERAETSPTSAPLLVVGRPMLCRKILRNRPINLRVLHLCRVNCGIFVPALSFPSNVGVPRYEA